MSVVVAAGAPPCWVTVAAARPEVEWVDEACVGRAADVATQLAVEFSLNRGTIAVGNGYDVGEDLDMAVELAVQFADVA